MFVSSEERIGDHSGGRPEYSLASEAKRAHGARSPPARGGPVAVVEFDHAVEQPLDGREGPFVHSPS